MPDMADVRARRLERIVNDPECVGDLLAVAMVLAAWLDFGVQGERPDQRLTLAAIQRRAFGGVRTQDWRYWKASRTISGDARTYRIPDVDTWTCTAPMIRANRPTCDRPASHSGNVTDLDTGERRMHQSCGRHKDWFWRIARENRAAVKKAEERGRLPLPAANHGGVLARHFPEIGWPRLWEKLDPRWTEHPESTPTPRPTLTLHIGGGEETFPHTPDLRITR